MDIIERNELKATMPELIAFIQQHHVMGPEIEKELFIDRVPVEGLCHTRGYFIIWKEFYLQYEMDHIVVTPSIGELARRVNKVIIYESYQEYESERVKAMSAVKPNEQTGLNLN